MTSQYEDLIFPQLNIESAFIRLQRYGCILLKNMIPEPVIQELKKRALFVFNLREQERLAGTLPEGYKYHYDYGFVTYLGIRELDLPAELPYQVLRMFQQLPLMHLIAKVFRDTIAVNLSHTVVRRLPPGKEELNLHVPFHQDGPLGGDTDVPVLNCWVPLVACGIDIPSLEVLPIGLKEALPVPDQPSENVHKMYKNIAIPEEQIFEQFPRDLFWQPVMEPGDILLMDHHVVHRTHITPAMSQERFSMEIRLVPSTQIPPELQAMGFMDIYRV